MRPIFAHMVGSIDQGNAKIRDIIESMDCEQLDDLALLIGTKMVSGGRLKNLIYSLALVGLGNAILNSKHASEANEDGD